MINSSRIGLKDESNLVSYVNESDLVIITSPLYVDCLPSPLIRSMEIIANARKDVELKYKPNLLAIINCGFPESLHNNVGIDICNYFALESKMNWLGGVGIGGGMAINGRALSEVGNIKHIIQGLDLISDCILNEHEIPKEVFDLLSKQSIPTWLYVNFGNIGWRLMARKNKVKTSLFYRPYE